MALAALDTALTGFIRKLVPTSPTTEIPVNVWVREVNIVNPTGLAITVTILDGAGFYMLFQASVAANGGTAQYSGATKMLNGFIWSASATGLTGYVRYVF